MRNLIVGAILFVGLSLSLISSGNEALIDDVALAAGRELGILPMATQLSGSTRLAALKTLTVALTPAEFAALSLSVGKKLSRPEMTREQVREALKTTLAQAEAQSDGAQGSLEILASKVSSREWGGLTEAAFRGYLVDGFTLGEIRYIESMKPQLFELDTVLSVTAGKVFDQPGIIVAVSDISQIERVEAILAKTPIVAQISSPLAASKTIRPVPKHDFVHIEVYFRPGNQLTFLQKGRSLEAVGITLSDFSEWNPKFEGFVAIENLAQVAKKVPDLETLLIRDQDEKRHLVLVQVMLGGEELVEPVEELLKKEGFLVRSVHRTLGIIKGFYPMARANDLNKIHVGVIGVSVPEMRPAPAPTSEKSEVSPPVESPVLLALPE